MIKVSISSDHAGFSLRMAIKGWLTENHYTIFDYGCSANEIVDYPDYVKGVLNDTRDAISDYGILICGSGIGMSIAANRYANIRAALCYNTEIARLAREHNNANVICLGAIFTSISLAREMLKAFLNTEFTGGRHKIRVQKLENLV